MIFKDYYYILNINIDASDEEVKIGFKKQALRWHPDKNVGVDTTTEMQEINEAYLILKDKEARERYNVQYHLFKPKIDYTHKSRESYKTNSKTNFENTDEVLEKWMNNAHNQSIALAQELVLELRATSKRALIGAGEGFISAIKWQLVICGFFFVLLLISKACH